MDMCDDSCDAPKGIFSFKVMMPSIHTYFEASLLNPLETDDNQLAAKVIHRDSINFAILRNLYYQNQISRPLTPTPYRDYYVFKAE